ncbi:8-oxoguanine deaminase [Shewanella sp. D64]|uniref:8-oxoguanine deaminase n=1 Tax=unclassified Shewanella TaxID=196818 RepID=UPI0022BA4F78|nr:MULTISPECIES: 8-oxoguanine deaminase [unclassified Shewanella]MEC4725235.1 8-oxoguanine deaminase [Shewanella sp. D64]MEC4735919.1 8-oxoguanine deaminase [Shewanella sp. E94]WBJ93114.1 8-oxoguanine deaminase [Shewanella sp. MTB7]
MQAKSNRIWIKNPLDCLDPSYAAGIVVQDDIIKELIAADCQPLSVVDEVIDAREHVLIPGLINSHHHFYQTLTRAFPAALNKALFPWLQSLYPVWAKLTPEMVATSTTIALSELLLSGCTTASDHHYLFPNGLENAIDIQIEQARKLGIRVHLTRGSMSLGEDQGGLPPRTTIQTDQQILDDSQRLIKRYHQHEEGAMTRIALAPCSPFSVSEELMRATGDLAEEFDVRLHTHLAETHDETEFCIKMFGVRPVDYLERVGWLNNRTWLAHGIHFNEQEISRLGEAGVGVCHCPSSNMLLASGQCPTLALEAAGSPVGLGVDGSASNDGSNMIGEVRQALLLQRLRYGACQITHQKAFNWATKGSAACLGRDDIGEIAVGKQADIALFKLDEIRFAGSGSPVAALLLCGATKADKVMVAGQWRVLDGKVLDLDLNQLMAQQIELAMQLAKS